MGPPKGSIPPARQVHPSTLHWKDAEKQASSSSSSDTELCDDDDVQSSSDEEDNKPNSKSQFTDNLNSGDTNLMKTDNTVSASDDANAVSLAMPTDDKPITHSLSPSPVNLKLASDSEDESAEFESFLADRVKCLKDSDFDASADVSVSSFTRRNSEMALQIIQENSLILHRIMQCQSRLSPSPPLGYNNASETIEIQSDLSSDLLKETLEESEVDTKLQKMDVYSWIDSQIPLEFNSNTSNYTEPDCLSEKHYESRFHSILEKSKSLDERYNSLFSGSSKETVSPFLGGLHESKSETPVGCKVEDFPTTDCLDIDFFESTIPKRDSEDTLIVQSISDDGDKDSKSNKLIQENLDLLKAFSANKAKEQQENRKKLIQENVSLLESISSTSSNPVVFVDEGSDLKSTIDDNITSSAFKDQSPELLSSLIGNHNQSSKLIEFDRLTDFLTVDCSDNDNNFTKDLPIIILDEKDSAISIGDSSTSKASETHCLVNLDDDFLDLHSAIKPSGSLSPVDFKTKQEIIDYSCDNVDVPKPSLDLNLKLVSPTKVSLSANSPSPNSSRVKSPVFSRSIFLEQPTKTSNCDEPINLNKSPSHVFNPFPVALNSRQNKEVPLKLGLYKK